MGKQFTRIYQGKQKVLPNEWPIDCAKLFCLFFFTVIIILIAFYQSHDRFGEESIKIEEKYSVWFIYLFLLISIFAAFLLCKLYSILMRWGDFLFCSVNMRAFYRHLVIHIMCFIFDGLKRLEIIGNQIF